MKHELDRRDFLKMGAGAIIGAAIAPPLVTEPLHLAYTELVREHRNKVPHLLSYVPDGSVAFGVWPNQNQYFDYAKDLERVGQVAGFFVPRNMANEALNHEITATQQDGKVVVLSCSWNVQGRKNKDQYGDFAKALKQFPKPFFLRPNYEANQHAVKASLGIRDPEEFVDWWNIFYSVIREEEVNCKFIFCANTTDNIFNTDQIKPYIPKMGISMATLDTYNRYHKNSYDPKHILPNFSAYEQLAHDVAVLQEELPGIPLGITEFGAEENAALFKADVLATAPYFGMQVVMSFDWKKDVGYGPDETDWRSTKNKHIQNAVVNASKTPPYILEGGTATHLEDLLKI